MAILLLDWGVLTRGRNNGSKQVRGSSKGDRPESGRVAQRRQMRQTSGGSQTLEPAYAYISTQERNA